MTTQILQRFFGGVSGACGHSAVTCINPFLQWCVCVYGFFEISMTTQI